MAVVVRVRAERSPGEKRVAASAESVRKLVAAGASVEIESGAGHGALISDAAYRDAGATIVEPGTAVGGGILFHVRPVHRPSEVAAPAGAGP